MDARHGVEIAAGGPDCIDIATGAPTVLFKHCYNKPRAHREAWAVGRGLWEVERGTWNVGHGTWNVERGTWNGKRGNVPKSDPGLKWVLSPPLYFFETPKSRPTCCPQRPWAVGHGPFFNGFRLVLKGLAPGFLWISVGFEGLGP